VSLNHSASGKWFGLAGYAVNKAAKGLLFVLPAAVTIQVLAQDDVVLRLWRRGRRAMQGSLGEKIGHGANSDVHAWAPGQVVKLLKSNVTWERGAYEARMSRAAFAAGLPAPEVLGEVTVDRRFGIVMRRLDGPTLLELLRNRAMTAAQAGAILASLYRSVHETELPGAITLHYLMATAAPYMPRNIAFGILALMERLPMGEGLCHLDLHTNNVIMTTEGPRIIDWAIPVRAPAAVDLARCHVTHFDLVYEPEDTDPKGAHAINAAVQAEYARLAGRSLDSLTAAIEPWLPVMRAFVLADRAIPAGRRESLLRSVEAALGPED
jgi:tRNA A-37 threonylcarbamoyl transferase component Bud32